MERNRLQIVLLFVALVGILIINITTSETNAMYVPSVTSEGRSKTGYEICLWISWFLFGTMSVILYILADRYYRSLRELRTVLNNFDVANARLSMESDRIVLLNIIGEIFQGSPELAAQRVSSQVRTPQHGSQMSAQQSQLREGIENFNRSLRISVKDQLPVDGIRSWNVFQYPTAVLLLGILMYLDFFDAWGFTKISGSQVTYTTSLALAFPYKNFASVVGLAYGIFVLNPFFAFLLSCEAKFFLKLHELSKLPQWTSWLIFLPLFVFFESVLAWRELVEENLKRLIFVDMIAGMHGDGTNPFEAGPRHTIWFAPFYSVTQALLKIYHDPDEPIPTWMKGYYVYFDRNAWVDALLWIFLVIPLTLFTYWLYEPRFLRRARYRVWAMLCGKGGDVNDAQ